MKNNNLIAINGKIGHGKDTIGNIIQILIALPHLTDTGVKSFLGREIDSPYKIKKFADKLKDMVCLLIGCSREQLECREFKEKELGEEWWYWKIFGYNGTNPNGNFILIPYDNSEPDKYDKITLIKSTPRLFMQILGTEAGREILHPNIWVNSLFADYTSNFTPCKNWKKDRENINCLCGGIYAQGQNRGKTMCEDESIPAKWIITDLRFPNEFEAVKDRGGITIKVNRNTLITDNNGDPIDPNKSYYAISTVQHPSETALDNETRWDYVVDNNSTIEDLIKKVREILIKENII